jgi:hypothetical protein
MKKVTMIAILGFLLFNAYSQTTDTLFASPSEFSNETIINLTLKDSAVVSLTVYDRFGQIIKSLVESSLLNAGNYQFGLNGTKDGVYVVVFDNISKRSSSAIKIIINSIETGTDDAEVDPKLDNSLEDFFTHIKTNELVVNLYNIIGTFETRLDCNQFDAQIGALKPSVYVFNCHNSKSGAFFTRKVLIAP